jgi:hypothetical protein
MIFPHSILKRQKISKQSLADLTFDAVYARITPFNDDQVIYFVDGYVGVRVGVAFHAYFPKSERHRYSNL